MDKEMISHASIAGWRRYAFKCPCCGEDGNIGLDPTTSGQFGCPAMCGASFIEYQLPDQRWEIRCVVQPVFAEQQD